MPDPKVTPHELGSQLTEVVEKNVQRVFVDAIDDDQWKALVKQAIVKFTQPRANRDNFNKDVPRPSELEELIHGWLRARMSTWLTEKLEDDSWKGVWDGWQTSPSDIVKDMLRALMPDIIKAQYGAVIQNAVDQVQIHFKSIADQAGEEQRQF